MMTIRDKNGVYRLEAVAAVTPHVIYKAGVHKAGVAPEIDKTVAVVHLAGGSTIVTDTAFTIVADLLDPPTEQTALPGGAS